jgi:heme/copper-type cytochrome/quinol oxidase subunit 2
MTNLSSKILTKIETDNIKPIPRWRFLLKDSVTWIVSLISLLVGGIGVSISIFLVVNNDILTTSFSGLNIIQTIVLVVPIFWVAITIFFIFLAYYNFKHTPEGYRWNVAKMLVVNIIASIFLGIFLYSTDISSMLNDVFNSNIPYYNQIADVRNQVWMRPETGYLAGDIQEINTANQSFTIKDLNNSLWTVDYSIALVKPSVNLVTGTKIKIIGEKTDSANFKASEIRPWNGGFQSGSQGRQLGMQENSPHYRIN